MTKHRNTVPDMPNIPPPPPHKRGLSVSRAGDGSAPSDELVYAVKRDIERVARIYPSAFNLYDEPLDRLARRVIATVQAQNGGGEGRAVARTSPPPGSQVVCPLSATCSKDEEGCNAHCEPHVKGKGCDYGADGCPPCVPVSANAGIDAQEKGQK